MAAADPQSAQASPVLRPAARRDRNPWPAHLGDVRLAEIARSGDARATRELIGRTMPRVMAAARHYRRDGVDDDDLVQAGVLGLLTALRRYDPGRGVPFWGYASWYVRRAMQRHIADVGGPVVLSDRALRHLQRIAELTRRHEQQRRCGPSIERLRDQTGLSDDHLASLLGAARPARPLGTPLGERETDERPLEDVLADVAAEDELERALARAHLRVLRRSWPSLSAREQQILRARFGLDGGPPRTLPQIGAQLGITSERVRQLERQALAALRYAA